MKMRKVLRRGLRRTGALCLAAALSLSMFGTGAVLADTTDEESVSVEMYAAATAEFIPEEGLTAYEATDSYTEWDDDEEAFAYYSIWELFSVGDQIVVTTGDGDMVVYTYSWYDGELDFFDEDGSLLEFAWDSDQYTDHWEVGNTYYFELMLYYDDDEIVMQVPVTVEEYPHTDATVEAVFQNTLTLTFGVDTYESYTDTETAEQYTYYDLSRVVPAAGDKIVITTEDVTLTYTADGYGNYYDAYGDMLDYDFESDQSDNHWTVGGTYEVTMTLSDYGLEVPVTVKTAAPSFASAVTMTAGSSYTANITMTGDYVVYAITPASSGSYQFYSTGESDTIAYVLDASLNILGYNDNYYDTEDDDNFNAYITADLKKGTTYYVLYKCFSFSTGDFTVYANQLTSEGDEDIEISASDVTLAAGSVTYTGSAQTPAVTVKVGGTTLTAGTHYTVSYANNTNAGTANVTVTGKNGYTGMVSKTFTIAKAAQSITIKKANKTVKASRLKKKKQSVKAIKKVNGAQGTVTYTKVKSKNSSKFTVNKKTGKITVKKGTEKGTYKVKIKVTASGNANYEAVTKTITVKIKVK